MKKLLLLALMLSQATTAFAYDPQKGHKSIVTTAVKAYAQCFEDQSFYRINGAQERVIQGDLSMDEGLDATLKERFGLTGEMVFSKVIRPLNWHFYNPDRAAYSKVGLVEQSHINLWNDLIKGFNENKKEYNKILFVGGIIHLVEDLTVPAHVVPVYHGPTQIEYFGTDRLKPLVSYMQDKGSQYSKNIDDKIDSIAPDVERLKKELAESKDICARANTGNKTLEDLRASTVQFTLDQLQHEIPNCPAVKWQDFWLKPTGNEFFGRYNIAHNNPMFGEAGVLVGASNATCQLKEMDSRYLDFVFALHLKAVESDMRVLSLGQQ